MGNERSALNGLEVDEKSVEVTDFWVHHAASLKDHNTRKVSVFISEPSLHYSASFGKPSPLERLAKNLMLHRHPCILKYVSSWSRAGKFFLTTEQVRPLIQVIETQNTLQICIGLYSILRSLVFLHEKASASHNNVCASSIYVTPEGCWKLGGLEYLCKSKELTPAYIRKIKKYRYEKAIPPDEDTTITPLNFTAIDTYAFGVLAEDILKSKNLEDIPGLAEFREFCKDNLQNEDPCLRSKLLAILKHPFFNHDFMRIHAFLEELPLKINMEKEAFFENLVTQLRVFPENVVAEQLGRLLLSRIVLLDTTAQRKLLPFVLKPRDETDENNLFSISTYKAYIIPKLLQMFCIRDASIRLVLLSHFHSFVCTFQVDELKSQILPELLVGIKDTNDHLVCATLRALADIVPILGAATVIGGNRGKLFTDGRPNDKTSISDDTSSGINSNFANIIEFSVPTNAVGTKEIELPERPSPDGGEDKAELGYTFVEEEYAWSDWEAQEVSVDAQHCVSHSPKDRCQSDEVSTTDPNSTVSVTSTDTLSNTDKESKFVKKVQTLSDISELDIKNSKSSDSAREEYDFFTDMEPVIKKTQILHVQQPTIPLKSIFDVKTFNSIDGVDENNVWNEDLSDWDAGNMQD